MSTIEAGTNDRLDALHARMGENSLVGHSQPRQQRPELLPWLWQWRRHNGRAWRGYHGAPVG